MKSRKDLIQAFKPTQSLLQTPKANQPAKKLFKFLVNSDFFDTATCGFFTPF